METGTNKTWDLDDSHLRSQEMDVEWKSQQQEDDKMNKSLSSSKSTAAANDKETSNSNTPNQYARVKNTAEVEQ
jgi:hypothetical protein